MNTPIVAGKYTLIKKIASGGMAEVFLAKQAGLDGFEKLVVLKRVLPHLSTHAEFTRMFLDEAKTAADLRHPHLVHTYEIGEDAGVYFMVMEFLHGQDLRRLMKSVALSKQRIPLSYGVGIIMDAASGIHYAHTKTDLHGNPLGIVHRDISPQNIIITYEGLVKIVDFGIAKAAHQREVSSSGVLKGKYCYMSPEQALGHTIDALTDQFALGIVLYEMTTMRRLFKRDSELLTLKAVSQCQIMPPKNVVSDYPVALNNIVMKALQGNKNKRFKNCHELRLALEEFLESERHLYSTARLASYMRSLFNERIIEEEKALVQGQLHAESILTNLAEAQKQTLSFSKPKILKEETGSIQSVHQNIWRHASVGLFAFVGGLLGIALVVIAVQLFLSTQDKVSDQWVLDKAEQIPSFLDSQVVLTAQEPSLIREQKKKKKADKLNAAKDKRQTPPQKATVLQVKPHGRLKVVVDPWAEVYVNGDMIGITPLAPIAFPPGKYTIRLINPKIKKDVTRRIAIASSQDTLVREKW